MKKFYTHQEMLDKHIGKVGTSERGKFDSRVKTAINKRRTKSKQNK